MSSYIDDLLASVTDDILRQQGITTRPSNFPWNKMDGPVHWLTKDEAIMFINEWRKEAVPQNNLYFSRILPNKFHLSSGFKNVYANAMLDLLIERIKKSDHDPITVVAQYNYEMDDILAVSDMDHHVTHYFASFMERESYDLLLYLKDKEKELNLK